MAPLWAGAGEKVILLQPRGFCKEGTGVVNRQRAMACGMERRKVQAGAVPQQSTDLEKQACRLP
jgi:hypothetical protein